MGFLYVIKNLFRRLLIGFWRFVGLFAQHDDIVIVFDSYLGKQYSCNPRYIYEYMLKTFPRQGIRYIWAFREPDGFSELLKDNNTTVCRFYSLKHMWFACMADIQITNFNMVPSERIDQIRVETWHGGGCYKKVGTQIESSTKWYNWYIRQKYKSFTCFLSSSQYFSEHVIKGQFGYQGEILEFGMPRNDILIHPELQAEKAHMIRNSLEIQDDRFIVLYAPTYRESPCNSHEQIDYNLVIQSVREKFGRDAVVLYRGHHFSRTDHLDRSVMDVSTYPDMQELLLVTDMLITDYSSSIWDFSFTGRPCFLYTPDLDEYIKYRGFNIDIHEWGFPVCHDNRSLMNNILAYDEIESRNAIKKHHKKLQSFEEGYAAEKICKYLSEKKNITMTGLTYLSE